MHKEFLDFVIIGDMSFTLFENKKLESFMQRNLQHVISYNFKKYKLKWYFKKLCKYEIKIIQVFQTCGRKICLTSYWWSFREQTKYLSLNAHYIDDDWVMQ